jgi:hypothetical protein
MRGLPLPLVLLQFLHLPFAEHFTDRVGHAGQIRLLGVLGEVIRFGGTPIVVGLPSLASLIHHLNVTVLTLPPSREVLDVLLVVHNCRLRRLRPVSHLALGVLLVGVLLGHLTMNLAILGGALHFGS